MTQNKHISRTVRTHCMVSLLVLLGPWTVTQAQELPPEIVQYADTVLHNGTVLPMDRDQPPLTVAQAVALRNGRIMAVGTNDRILPMAGPDTVRVDLGGKTVIPGIVDTHSHPNRYALRHYVDEVTPPYLKSLEERNVMFATLRWETKETVLADFEKFVGGLSPGQLIYTTTQLNRPVIYVLT